MFADFRTEAMFSQRLKRAISALVLFFFSFTFYSPALHAAWIELEEQNTPVRNSLSYINPVGETLQELAQQVDTLEQALESDTEDAVTDRLQRIQSLSVALEERDAVTRQELRDEQYRLEQRGAPAEAVARHRAFQENYLAHMKGLEQSLGRLESADNGAAIKPILADLKQYLGHSVRNPQQSFSNDLDFVAPPPRNLYTSQSAVESVLGVTGDPAWSLTDYLETDTATQSSERIENLVSDMSGDPLALYQWVKNTIRYVPSYGLMQGADYTLQSEQGNAFDTASTLIALYRQAGIPARYSYGTVSLSAEAVQNWVGGVTNVSAATNIISQGGIPQQQLSYGGAAEEVELEHVWVEAWIDGEWVALDPSFKQYTFTDGLDIESQVALDADQFLAQLQSSAIINEAEGWVQGLDASQVQSQLEDYQARVESFINSQNSNATLGDVLGTQKIVADQAVSLAEVQLPYNDIRASAVVPNLPESLYYKFRLQIGDTFGGSFGAPVQWGSVTAELERTTAELVGKSIAISFRPATIADQQTLESYLPANPQSVEDLPEQLPANTINMIGEITVDGEVVASTPTVTLGQSLMTRLGFDAPARNWRYSENNLIAGKYQAVGIDMQGISPTQLEALKSRVEEVSSKLSAENYAGLTKHDLVGSILQAGIQGYLAETYAMDKIAAAASDIVYNRSPSYGTFSTEMNVSYLFGMPRNVFFSGVVMDVDQISANTESVDNCYEDWVAFNRSSGMRSSAYEHLIPERLFSTEEKPVEGVSTAKALALAMAQGQRIYTLTQDNAYNLSQITIDSEARSEIQNALQRGYEVTVHENPLNVNGWEGSGYAIIDPANGVGAYKIIGGASGGWADISAALGALLQFLSFGSEALGELEKVVKGLDDVLGGVFSSIARIIGGLGVALAGFDAYLAGCSGGAIYGIVAFGIAGVALSLALGLFLGPVAALVVGVLINVAITALQNSIKKDFC